MGLINIISSDKTFVYGRESENDISTVRIIGNHIYMKPFQGQTIREYNIREGSTLVISGNNIYASKLSSNSPIIFKGDIEYYKGEKEIYLSGTLGDIYVLGSKSKGMITDGSPARGCCSKKFDEEVKIYEKHLAQDDVILKMEGMFSRISIEPSCDCYTYIYNSSKFGMVENKDKLVAVGNIRRASLPNDIESFVDYRYNG